MADEKDNSSRPAVHPAAIDQKARIEQMKAHIDEQRKAPTNVLEGKRKAESDALESAGSYMGTGGKLQTYKPDKNERKYN